MGTELLDGFEHNYTCTIGCDLDGSELHFSQFSQMTGQDGSIVNITPKAGSSWLGVFAYGQLSDKAVTGVFSTPNPDTVCIIAKGEGYWVPVLNPSKWEFVKSAPIVDVRCARQNGLILFMDHTEIVAYGKSGLVWTSDRLSLDGFKILSLQQDKILGRYYSHSLDSDQDFTIDLFTGKRLSAPFTP